MIIETKFELGEKVAVKEINKTGKVMAFFYATQIEYKVRYFDGGDPRELFFYEDEISKVAKTI